MSSVRIAAMFTFISLTIDHFVLLTEMDEVQHCIAEITGT